MHGRHRVHELLTASLNFFEKHLDFIHRLHTCADLKEERLWLAFVFTRHYT